MSTSTPGAITVNGSGSGVLGLCSTAPITLAVPQLAFPFPTGTPPANAEQYEWTIPSGWLWPDGATATGAPRVFAGNTPYTIQVTPTPGGTGTVTVRAIDYECGERRGRPRLYSLPQSLPITRQLPTLTAIAASRSPLYCGDTAPLTLTATLSQGGGTTVVYNWPATLPNGWAYQGGTPPTGPSAVVLPSGQPGPVSFALTASYSCGSVSGTTPAFTFNTTVNQQVATPEITSPVAQPYGQDNTLCGPTTFVATPGAGSYQWTTSWGLSFTTTANTTSIAPPLSPTGPGYASGRGWIRVRAQNAALGCTPSEPAAYYVAYGPPAPYSITYDDSELCSRGLVAFQIYDVVPGTYQWAISGSGGRFRFGSAGERVLVYLNGRTGSFSLSVVPTNACGNSNAYEYQAGTFNNADFNYSCDTPGLTLAPNPATNEVVVQLGEAAPAEARAAQATAAPAGRGAQPAQLLPVRRVGLAQARAQGEYTLHLYDQFGQEVKTAETQQQQRRLSVADLPSGTYYLRAVRGQQVVARQLLIQH